MSKFSNVKVNDTVYHLICGKGQVETVWLGGGIVTNFLVKFKTCEAMFDVDGYLLDEDFKCEEKIVTLYWNEVKLPTEEEDKKPFGLAEFLQESVSPVEFFFGESNYFIYYDELSKVFAYECVSFDNHITTVYLDSGDFDYVVEELNSKKVTPQQLKEAYKTLGWL